MKRVMTLIALCSQIQLCTLLTIPKASAHREDYIPVLLPNWDVRYRVHTETTAAQILAWGAVGLGAIIVLKLILHCPGAFYDITPPTDWTYVTDGETYLTLEPPYYIDQTGNYLLSTERGNFLARVGGVVVSVDKFGLLAPYIGLASIVIVAAAVATTIYVKRRKEKH